jgi:NhaP-type Na+/H+ or K+/H+ antiporter
MFGVALVGPVILAGFDPAVIVYALLSLTIVRMVPVAIALVGARLRPDTVALIGWFGPRGLASVVFLFIALDELGPAHPATDALVRAVTWTVLLSVFLHGLSARPFGAWYGRRIARAAAGDWERGRADEPRISRRHSWARPPSEGD